MSISATIEEKAATPARRTFHLRSIRTRLLVIFVLLVLLPAVIIGVVAAVGSLQSGQLQALNQLESVATLKQGEINNWVQGLQLDLSVEPTREQDAQRLVTLVQAAPDTADYQAAYTALLSHFQQSIELRKNFEELLVMDSKGRVVLSTDAAQVGKFYDKQGFFVNGLKGSYVQPPFYATSLGRMSVIVAQPVKGEQGQAVGVLAGRANIARFSQIMTQRTGLGETGETYLVGSNSALLTEVLSGEKIGYVHTRGTADAISSRRNGSGTYENYQGVPVLGVYHWLPDLQVALVAEQAQSEAFASTYTTLGIVVGIALVAVLVAAAIGFVVTRGIANPLANLAETSARIAGGDLAARAQAITSGDEIGVLATSFNAMADRVGTLLTGLGERSRELEASQRVAVAASERVSPDDLLDLVVNLVRDQFNLYHVQVYIVDEEQAAAVLRQSTGFAGRQLLQKGHKISLDRPALVTQAIREGQPVLVDDVAQTAGFLPNPLLPDTKSELVVPLKVGDKVIGVLDAQDRTPGRFGQSTVALFQTMANQISFLFENSQLLQRTTAQTEALNLFTNQLRTAADIAHRLGAILDPERLLQQVVELMQSRFGLYHAHIYVLDEAAGKLAIRAGSGEVGRVLRERGHSISLDAEKSLVARAARSRETVLVNDTTLESDFMPNPLLPQTRSEVALPLIIGDRVLGVLDVQDDQAGRFTQADLDTFATLAGQIATSLQNASLFGQVERNLEETRVRLGVSQALAPAQTEEEVLDTITQHAGLYPQARVTLLTFDPQAEERTLVLRRDSKFESGIATGLPVGTRMPASRFPLMNLITQDKPFVSTNELTDERVDEGTRELVRESGYTAAAVMPMTVGTEFLGILAAVAQPEGYFDERKVHLYQTLAEQGAMALQAARLRDAMLESEERFRSIVEHSHGGIFTADGAFHFIYANDRMAEILGYPLEELVGIDFRTLLTQESLDLVSDYYIRRQKGEKVPDRYEVNFIRKDGEQRIGELSATSVRDAAGNVRTIAQLLDITERKRAEEALDRERNLLRSLIDNVPDYIYVKDAESRFLMGNPAVTHLMGVETADELIGKNDFDFYPEELAAKYHADEQAIIQSGQPLLQHEEPLLDRAGNSGWLSTTKVPLRDAQGHIFGLVGMGRNITEQKRAAEALADSEARYSAIVRQSNDGIVIIQDNVLQVANQAMADILGYATPDEIENTPFIQYIAPESRALVAARVKARLAGEDVPPIYEAQLLRKDGTIRDAELSAGVIQYRGKSADVGAIRDITERKRAEEAVRESQQMLRLVMNNIPQSIFWKDRNLTYLGCNRNFADDAALAAPEEVIGKNDYDMPWVEQAELYRADDSRVMDSGEPVLSYEEPQTTPDGSQIWLRTSKVPLRDAVGNVTAVLGMYEDITDRKRAEAERERFTTQLGTAADVAGQVSAILDPDQLLNAVIPLLHDRFQLYHVHFYGLDAAAGELVLRAGYGEPGRVMLERGHKIPLEREQSLVARAARTKEAVLVNDVTSAPDFLSNPLLPETRSEVAVPAIAGGQVLGVFDVQQNVPDYFTEADLDVFTTLTGQIATALQNAGYVELVESRLHVSQTLAGAQTEEQVLDAMIKAADFYPEAQVLIFTLAGGTDDLTVIARRVDTFASGQQLAVQPGMAFPASLFTLLDLISADKPFVSANALTDERIDPASREMMRQTGGAGLAVLPVTAGDEWIGLIAAISPHEGYFDERKLYLYDSLAEQGAIALRTARLRDQVQESLAETQVRFEVSQALAGAQTEEEVLDALIQQMGVYPKAQVGIDLIDPGAAERTFVVRRNATFDSGIAGHEPGMRFSATQFGLARLFSPDTPFVSSNTQLDERFDPGSREFARKAGHISIAILPITAGTEWLGVIGAFSSEEGYFDEDKLHLYRTLADQGAVALHTARLYDETQRASERLKEVDRLKSEFLANMSHELRTPLNSILGYTEVMLMGIDGEMDPETQADVQAIYDNGQHLLHLISDILDLAKIEAGRLTLNFETVDMRPLIDEIVTSTNGLLLKRQKSVELNVEVAEDLPAAHVDRLRLNQILNNLLSNAVKFTEEGHITLRAATDDDHICFEVQDTGIGISSDDQERIFDQFRQADGSYKRRAEGTGLGLSITRYLVEMHGGTIVVHSRPGQGSTFTVRLPLKRQTAEQGTEAAAPLRGKGKGRGKGK